MDIFSPKRKENLFFFPSENETWNEGKMYLSHFRSLTKGDEKVRSSVWGEYIKSFRFIEIDPLFDFWDEEIEAEV